MTAQHNAFGTGHAERRKGLSRKVVQGVVAATAIYMAAASPAYATWVLCGEGKSNDVPWGGPFMPEKVHVDANGVDLGLGNFSPLSGPSISIGDPENGGLTYTIHSGASGENWQAGLGNFHASVTKKKSNISTGEGYYQVNGLNSSDTFYRETSTSAFEPVKGNGATLTAGGGAAFTYTSSDGTVTTFSNAYHGEPARINAYEGRVGKIYQQTRPNGEVITFEYDEELIEPQPLVGSCAEQIERLTTVNSNFGYRVVTTYEYNSVPTTNGQWHDWIMPSTTTAYNLSVDGTSYTGEWPSLSYSGEGHEELDSVTNAEGGVTYYTYTTGYANKPVASIRFPGSASADVTITYETDTLLSTSVNTKPRVTSVTRYGETWEYDYSDSGDITSGTGATRTVTVTAPDNSETVVVTKLWMSDIWYNGELMISFGRIRANLISVTDPLGRTTSYEYDAYDRKTKETFDEGNYVEYEYDDRGNVVETTMVAKSGSGLSDIVTTATFPGTCTYTKTCNKPTSVTDALGNTTDYTYDNTHGGVLTETLADPDGGSALPRPQTRYTYAQKQARAYGAGSAMDAIYMLTEVSQCITGSSCDAAVNESLVTNAYPSSSNPNNIELLSVTRSSGNSSIVSTTAYTYDEWKNRLTEDGPISGTADTTRMRYDEMRRVIGVIGPDPDGGGARKHAATRTTYNTRGLPSVVETGYVTSQSDGDWAAFTALQKVETLYDTYGRKSELRGYDGASIIALRQFSYDINSRLECSTRRMNPSEFSSLPASACTLDDPGFYGPDRITKTVYDDAGQITKTILAYGTADEADDRISTYTDNGLLATLKDPNGNMTTYVYDGFDRLVEMRFPSKTTAGTSAACSSTYVSTDDCERYAYDAAGNITTQRLRDGVEITNGYDFLNRQTSRDAPGTASDVSYAYNNFGLQTSIAVPSHTTTYDYDALGRLTSEEAPLGAVDYLYDLADRNIRVTWPDSFYAEYVYDPAGLLTEVRENGATSGAGLLATYDYDNIGRRVSISRGNGVTTALNYDAASRLTDLDHDLTGSVDDETRDFAFNPASQIISRAGSNAGYHYTENTPASLSSTFNGLNQPTVIGGVSITHDARGNLTSDGTTTYGYDVNNRLVSGTGGTVLTYDANGRLIQTEKTSLATTQFLYAGEELIAEYDDSDDLQRRYVHGAEIDDPIVWYEGDDTADRRWLLADERGSIIAVTDASGDALQINTYDAYGKPGASNLGRFQYTGQTFISEVGLYHYKARFYSPDLGRFLQTDPIWYEDQTNLYGYVGNDPINATDPSGEKSYLVSRPIDALPGVSHMFVIVVDDITGEVTRFSYGAMGLGPNAGQLVSLTDTGEPTDIGDRDATTLLLNDPEEAANSGISAVVIEASDDDVRSAGQDVTKALGTPENPGPIRYFLIPRIGSRSGNSNTAAYAVSNIAAKSKDPNARQPLPKGTANLTGWRATQNVEALTVRERMTGQECLRPPEQGGCSD